MKKELKKKHMMIQINMYELLEHVNEKFEFKQIKLLSFLEQSDNLTSTIALKQMNDND